MVGPPLTYFSRRTYIGGEVANQPDNLVRWVMSPQSIEPHTAMPNLGLNRTAGARCRRLSIHAAVRRFMKDTRFAGFADDAAAALLLLPLPVWQGTRRRRTPRPPAPAKCPEQLPGFKW